MKKFFITMFVLVVGLMQAQVSDLSELVTGELQVFSPILELDDSVYGYAAIYKLDDNSKSEAEFSYIIFDKNLNKLSNGSFVSVVHKRLTPEYLNPQKVGNHLIFTQEHDTNPGYLNTIKFTYHWVLDLTTNKMSKPFHLEGDKFVDGFFQIGSNKALRDMMFFNSPTHLYPIPTKGEGFVFKTKFLGKPIVCYKTNKEQKWSYRIVDKKDIPKTRKENIVHSKETLAASIYEYTNQEFVDVLNPLNGELKFKYHITKKKPAFKYRYKVTSNESNYHIAGLISPILDKVKKVKYNKKAAQKALKIARKLAGKKYGKDFEELKDAEAYTPEYSYTVTIKHSKKIKPTSGLFKITLDKEGKEVSRKEFLWRKNTHKDLDIDMYGEFDDGYRFLLKDVFNFKDGSTAFLGEKSKKKSDKIKTSDLVLFLFDKDFNLTTVEYIKKDKSKSKYSDYLYAQDIKDANGTVFFYADYKKDNETKNKNWVLGIVSIINGKVTKEQIPISSENHLIVPYLAKEGYILLREYNKDEDYDQIRLEKLNY